MSDGPEEKLRVDKWLWFARFFRTRTLAATAVSAGHLRINRQPVRKPGHIVRVGDVLTFAQGSIVRVIRIDSLADKRGNATIAQTLYTDLDPPQPRAAREPEPMFAERESGTGRPTKKERRQTDLLKGDIMDG